MKNANILVIVFSLLILSLFIYSWQDTKNKINDLNNSLDKKIVSITNLSTRLPSNPHLQNIPKISKKLLLKEEELEKLNDHLSSLTLEVQGQYTNAREIINNDIDRLNNYLAVGIGFIGLLGVFVPFIMSLNVSADAREKIKIIEIKLGETSVKASKIENDLNETSEKASSAERNALSAMNNSNEALKKVDEINEISTKVNEIEKITKESFPKVETLIIQSAIGRFFNMSPYVLSSSMHEKEKEHLLDILSDIKAGFVSCKNQLKYPSEDKFLKATIKDFLMSMKKGRFITGAFDKKAMLQFDQLLKFLEKLDCETNPFEIQKIYGEIDKTFSNLIDKIKNIIG